MTEQGNDAVVERFHPTSGWFLGILGLGAAAVVIVIAVVDWDPGTPLGVGILAALGALLVWVALLRPALWVTSSDLVMRGMFHTDRIPLVAIDKVAVGQVLAVFVGERRFVSPVIGYTARQGMKARMVAPGAAQSGASPIESHQKFVEARIAHLAQDTRDRAGVRQGSPEQLALAADVRRSYAWPEIAGVVVLSLAFVVWLLA